MGMGSGGVPLGAGKGVPTVPMGGGSSSPNVAAPSPSQSQARAQYSQPFQQQYMPPQQMQFSMAAPPRQYVQQPYNLSGALNTTNLASQQTNMPRQDHTYLAQTQQMSRPNYQNPTSIAQLQAMYGTRPSGGEVRSAPVYQPQPQIPPELQQLREANMRAYQQQPQQQYFRPQQYQQDPYMNYMRNQQQAMQQQAVQQGGIRQLQQADILRQQQVAQAAATQRAATQQYAPPPPPTHSAPDWQAG